MEEERALIERARGLQRRERVDAFRVRPRRARPRRAAAHVAGVSHVAPFGDLCACEQHDVIDDDRRGRRVCDEERCDRHQQPEETQQVAATEHAPSVRTSAAFRKLRFAPTRVALPRSLEVNG